MTPQEISEFVNQPIPRKVPREISRKAINWHSKTILGVCISVLTLIVVMISLVSEVSIVDIMQLNMGTVNKMTTQGAIISITPTRLWGIGPTSYYLKTRFSTSGGYRIVASYVWRRRNIPGWGIIPETQNNPRLRETLTLTSPFPVTVEYLRNRSWIVARAAGTRLKIGISDIMLYVALLGLVMLASLAAVAINARRAMRLLRKGLFTTGYISLFTGHKYPYDGCVSGYAASFTDLNGVKREELIMLPTGEENQLWFLNFFCRRQPVGLLYLPDTNSVIVTDLWLDSNPTIGMSRKHDHKMRDMI